MGSWFGFQVPAFQVPGFQFEPRTQDRNAEPEPRTFEPEPRTKNPEPRTDYVFLLIRYSVIFLATVFRWIPSSVAASPTLPLERWSARVMKTFSNSCRASS